ncbi:MAG TPA: aminoacyl-tRNA hydrolase [Candidatus Binatia bacterium]|jgi:PTH1 family peptidyl-tRNA hydrolase
MKLIVGLGNPGERYKLTRHNLGFRVVDRLALKTGINLSETRCESVLGRGLWHEQTIVLAQPQTFMNRSGTAVTCLVAETTCHTADLVVIYDDLDLPFGQIRIRSRGSAGGHRGMLSILQFFGAAEFPRIRLGIGRPADGIDPADYVLENFGETELATIDEIVEQAAESAICLVEDGINRAMALYNRPRA